MLGGFYGESMTKFVRVDANCGDCKGFVETTGVGFGVISQHLSVCFAVILSHLSVFATAGRKSATPGTKSVSGSSFGGVMDVSSCCLSHWWSAGEWMLPAPEGFDNAHRATAIWAWFA